MDDHGYPQETPRVVAQLVHALTEAGLSAAPFGGSMVWASNPAADPPADATARAFKLNPGLRQAVKYRIDEFGRLGWYFVWHTPGTTPQYEWIGPAHEVTRVATRVATVLAVRPETAR